MPVLEPFDFSFNRGLSDLELSLSLDSYLPPPPPPYVTVQTKAEVDELCTHPALSRLGAEPLHGGLTQAAREACLGRFRSGRTKVRGRLGVSCMHSGTVSVTE